MTLVLWDIDHTLIESRGIGRELSAAAFEQITGQTMQQQAAIDGVTEPVIFRQTALLHGMRTGPDEFQAFARALSEHYRHSAGRLRERGAALPGAATALDALASAGVQQTVVTGNLRTVAQVKLHVFGLDHHIDWDIAAFGDEAELRPQLVARALERSRVDAADAVVIGDTPADVEGAHICAVRAIGVATGRSLASELRAAGADAVVEDLTETDQLLQLVTQHRQMSKTPPDPEGPAAPSKELD